MRSIDDHFELKLAKDPADLKAAQRLRYEVFVAELGGDGPLVDHDARLERDAFDPYYDHLLLIDKRRDAAALEHVVGVYRLLRDDQAGRIGRYYTESEYDLTVLKQSGRKLLELGRSCVHRDYRGGMALYHLWNGLAAYVFEHRIEVLFGVASFHGTDIEALKLPLAYLHHFHLAPEALRVRAQPEHFQRMDLMEAARIDRKQAMLLTPALIKAYLRLGGFVGEGAYVDHEFNTTDVCLIMDTARMTDKRRAKFEKDIRA
ncbi:MULTISPECIES: GNAT family N-acetyltransferase [Actibacterium]|uniref:L-ornithine N(alpha)-acyltransferase n=1 Tax=Actibacterium naphthalenivorans TaxID=1614693 RepID=A0A840CJQ2_9RHOB|nr:MULTISPECIES: GNAT family N-acyltransferase [Actibacterium]ALG90387.1 ornithine-acyl-ACP acyltransferase [Actibacterium sp. EMB200-NS6]MBB4022317.1 putative hemolysin [Actibacterium naphthalenivorans]